MIQQRATPLLEARGIGKEQIPVSATSRALRTTPPLFGFGLVNGIPEESILAHADPDDTNRDGIAGRANRFIDGRLGRFGRKAFIPTLFEFNAGAFPIEQGMTTPLQPVEETINGQPVPPETDPIPEPEVPLSEIEAVTNFTRFLAPPPRARVEDAAEKAMVKRGEGVFKTIGCAACHIPSLQTGPSNIPALNRQTVFLYSDLLLHDMGPGLADICLGLATPAEFRTELLMGLRFRRQFLHDGSARTVREAIERHSGEGDASRRAFEHLKQEERKALLRFLDTI
ncbi:MAG: di-heme oxidoredictase family protein [Candidatus Methylomirabilales bacterium]